MRAFGASECCELENQSINRASRLFVLGRVVTVLIFPLTIILIRILSVLHVIADAISCSCATDTANRRAGSRMTHRGTDQCSAAGAQRSAQ
jgi:hypothetical protein